MGVPLELATDVQLQLYPRDIQLTVIQYALGGTGGRGVSVRLAVYDMLGREVTTLVDETKAPGSYEVTFDAGRLASGVYLYRITAGPYTHSRKMLLLK